MDAKTELTTYSIGLEELALALGLINTPALSRRLLESAYGDQSQELTEARLTSASHALLAGGLCHFGKSGSLLLKPAFEQVLYPLAKYASFINVSLLAGETGADFTVALAKGVFTSRVILSGVIQALTYGPLGKLPTHLADLLDATGADSTARTLKASLTSAQLREATGKDAAAAAKLLAGNGWLEKDAALLAADMAAPHVNASLVHVHADDTVPAEKLAEAGQSTLLLLRGEKNTWAIYFPQAGDDAKGSVQLVDRNSLEALLTEFIA